MHRHHRFANAVIWNGLVFGSLAFAQAPSGDVVINSNTTWPAGNIQVNSLTVNSGATLTIPGGSTLTVAAGVTVTGNSNIVLQGANTSAQVNGSWQGVGVTLNAASIEVDAGSSINADGQGYGPNAGPGGALQGASTGGSYGGLGAGSQVQPTYGSATAPTDLGSGGGNCCGGGAGSGGGAVRLLVSGTLTNNGVISANGAATTAFAGGGAGGSVYVTAGSLVGSGSFTANGGAGASNGGGGGRVAVYYGANSNFTGFAASTATAGANGSPAATNGSSAFFDTSAPNANVSIYQNFPIPAQTTVTYNSLTVAAGGVLTIGGGSQVTVTDALTVSGTIVPQSIHNTAEVNGIWQGAGVAINAASITVNTGGAIDADGQGYVPNAGPGGAPSGTDDGGSYGGLGGLSGGALGPTYGSVTAPTDLGSGGGNCCASGAGSGGGAVALMVAGTLTNNGVISANGVGNTALAGGGAGGSLYVTAGTLAGSGSFAANGGAGGEVGATNTGGGGGGRIAILFTTNNGFNLANATANGGTGGGDGNAGQQGTVEALAANGNLTVADNLVLPPNASLTFGSVTIDNQGSLTLGSGTTLTASAITVSAGATLVIGGGSNITVAGAITVTGNSNIVLQGANTSAQVNGSWQGVGVTLNAASIEVDAGSSINADGQGYGPNAGPGGALQGASTGGSYGGLGAGNQVQPTYGSAAVPTDLGSGGGNCCGGGAGSGGGAVRLLVSGTLTNNGVISANGAATAAFAGGGAGGSVYVTAGSLVGSGSFTANGGTGASNGGGGGRVAVYYGANSNFTGFAASTATAGANGSPAATNGSSAFFDTSVTNSNVGIYQNFPIPAQTTVTYNSLTVAAGGVLTIGGGSQITVTSAFTVGGTIVAQSIDNTATLNGVWQGAGVEINAASVQVNAGGAISADGQGYVPNAGPAGAAPGSSNGGSYGGLGGGTGVGPTYGSITTPTDLGSGGGFCCGGGASPGGGAIRLLVTGALTNNGAISANGANAPAAGAGAGGSLYIAAGTLAGSGSFSANGGQGGSGGGGGRVAVYYAGSNGFNAGSITAAGGQGNNSGSPGSVNVSSTQSLLWLRPTESVLHGLETLQWFADFGSSVNLTLAGPQTFTLSAGAPLASTMAFDTTTVPDGRYELLLTALDAGGNTLAQQPLTVVVNNSVVWHSGTIASNQEWTANQVQGIDGVVVIPSGVTLTIDPGTIVKALPGAEIVVQSGGTLNAPGGVSLPVIFTTFDDSSVGGNTDFNAGISVPTPGEWQGVSVQTGGQLNSTNNTQFRYVSFPLSGTLSSQTLQSTSIYTVTGIAVVPSGVTLSIAPGTILKFNAGAGIAVQPGATFTAVGTVSQPIYFTSIKDDSVGGDTNGDGSATMPAPGDWASIVIDGAQATLVHVQMLYGSGPLSASADVVGMIETTDNATVTISDCMIAQGFWNGIQTGYPNGGGDTVTVTNTVLWGLGDRAINAWPGSIVHVVNDTIDGNSTGILSHGGTVDVANSIVSNTKSSQWGGIAACCGGTYTSIAYSDVWTSVAGVPNYSGLPDPTGANGNISANPVFVNEPQGIFQLNYGSPAIDAGNGTVANYPLTDFLGNARYNDPQVTTKTGVPDANGNYPDMGAFEFTATATSNIDLTVPTVTGPTSALVGNTVTINWTVTNIGSGVAYGPWHDAVYLVQDPDTNPVPIFAGQFLEGAGAVLGPGASYNASATIRVPGATIGNQRWEVKTNVLGEVFEGQNTVNNTGIALDPVAIDLTPLVVNGPAVSNSFAATGQSWWYKINPTAGRTLSLNLNLSAGPGAGSVQLFIGQGYVPTPQNFDIQQVQWNSPAASAVISNAANQTYYVTAYAQSLAASPASFGLTASTLAFSLTGVEPSNVINTGDATLTFTGGGFVDGAVFQLVGPSGTVYNPTAVFISDSATAQVTFSMSGLPTGSYTATVMLNGTTVKLNNAVAVALAPGQTGNSTIAVSLSTPAAFRTGFPAEVTLHYTNVSGVDQYAPLIGLTASGATMSLAPPQCTGCNSNFALQYQNTFTAGYVLGISEQGPAGILPAGTSGSVTFLVTPGTGTNVTFGIHSVQPSTLANTGVDAVLAPQGTDALIGSIIYQPIQLARQPKVGLPNDETLQVGTYGSAIAFCNGIMPPNASPLGFTRTCMQLLNESGFQYLGVGGGNYTPVGGALSIFGFNQVLAADATALSQMGIYEPNAANLLNFEFLKDGLAQFNQRYHQGAFGLGPSHPFDITAGLTGTLPTIYYPDGSARVFATPNPSQPNQYLGALGDYGVLTAEADGSWLVTENNGWLYHFIADPLSSVNSHHLLDYIQDLNGNRTSVTYTNDLATTITDSFGNTMTFEYDSQGHITKATDPVGRVTTYTYDVANASLGYAFLTSFTNPAGTTTLTWNEGGSNGVGYFDDTCVTTYCQAAIGINTIAYPDGTHTYFTYDTVGRRASQYNDNNSQQLTYSYGNNGVTVTDALGNTSTTALTAQGQVGQFTDPLANVTQFSYDPEVKLTRVLGPSGTSVAFGYDTSSDLNSWRDPRGNQTSMSFAADGYLQSLTDADGNAIAYSYNASYNPTGLTFPDGSAIQSTYDSRGNMLTYTNRRGHTTTFTYNQSNLLTSKTYANGAQVQYSYDTHRNLQSVTTSAGTTMYTYDSADRLTGVFYPNGQSVQYSYNSGGQRTGMNDSTGFAVNYTYDSVGRPSQLSNGSNRIVSYTYDAAGKLTQKTLGNGTYTTYAYDAAGNILHLVNYASNGSVLSEFDYTYDGLGRRIGMNSPAGAWTFSYDADSQLTLVTMPGGSVQYTYDAAGNRTASVSGSPSSFLVNNLNEYTQAGANSYQYDADGNLISGGGWTYTYDDDNWLVSAASATDTWSYQYDGLGNRISTTHNGTVTQYLNDPSGFGNVEAEFDGNGHLVGHYTYGLDLVSSVPAGGSVAYYHFDAAGNTAQVTNTSGSVVDSYTYLPFGEKLSSTGSLTNPFTFAGEFGVMDEGSGLYFMRQRWYNPPLGRFVQLDPTGLVGGSPNLYTYANNNPTSWIDPNGEAPYSWNWSNGSPALQQAAENRALLEQEGYQSQQAHEQQLAEGRSGIVGIGTSAMSAGLPNYAGHAIDAGTRNLVNVPEPDQGPSHWNGLDNLCGGCLFNDAPQNVVVPQAHSADPNGKLTSGFGTQGYIPPNVSIPYTIYFENQSSATAPAQKVVVTDPLPSNLDWSTLQLNQIEFNNVTINVPPGLQTYTTQVNVSTDPNPVNVSASLNPSSGVLTWTMQSVDPTTGGPPANRLAGFLPPNNASNQGTGLVTFTVSPKSGMGNAAVITNQASIVFDANAPIATNTVTNTIDSTVPTSSVNALPASTSATSFNVSWSGSDPGGSGIAGYNIFVAADGGQYGTWLPGTAQTSATFTAVGGHTYSFYSLAVSNVGTIQVTPGASQTIAVTASSCTIPGLGIANLADVQLIINQALGVTQAVNDLNSDGKVNVVDVEIAIGGVLGTGCTM